MTGRGKSSRERFWEATWNIIGTVIMALVLFSIFFAGAKRL